MIVIKITSEHYKSSVFVKDPAQLARTMEELFPDDMTFEDMVPDTYIMTFEEMTEEEFDKLEPFDSW